MAGIKKDESKEYNSNWGGARVGGGRKKKSEGGRVQLQISLSAEQRAKIKELAKQNNSDVSSFILDKVLN